MNASRRRRGILRVMVLMSLLAFGACSHQKSQIVGEWKVSSDTSALVWAFAPDGTVSSGDMHGRYSFGDQNRMKIQTPFATFVYQVQFAGEKMTWKSASGSTTELTRVKSPTAPN